MSHWIKNFIEIGFCQRVLEDPDPLAIVLLYGILLLFLLVILLFYRTFKKKKFKPKSDREPVVGPEVFKPAKAPVAAETKEPSPKDRLARGLSKTRTKLLESITRLFVKSPTIQPETIAQFEVFLLRADMGVATTSSIIDELKTWSQEKVEIDLAQIKSAIKAAILGRLQESEASIESRRPTPIGQKSIVLMLGVNGGGKTTTIAKLAYRYKSEGKTVLLVAADTFRAAAIAQLSEWAKRIDLPLAETGEGKDPSAVVFDALSLMQKEIYDVLLIDTAGRLHTKTNLMDELSKMARIVAKKSEAISATITHLLVVDATTGQNAIRQAQEFNAKVRVDGIILTKLDGTAKGGVVVAISEQVKIPIHYIGVGEQMDDLRDFHAQEFVDALFEEEKV